MRKITIILGAQGSGKTTKVRELAQGKSVYWVDNDEKLNNLPKMVFDYDLLIFEEVNSLESVKKIISKSTIKVRPLYTESMVDSPLPDTIIISNSIKAADFEDIKDSLTIIDLGQQVFGKEVAQ